MLQGLRQELTLEAQLLLFWGRWASVRKYNQSYEQHEVAKPKNALNPKPYCALNSTDNFATPF